VQRRGGWTGNVNCAKANRNPELAATVSEG
jgi:hypothetical protein